MTLPDERTRAVLNTRVFLRKLLDPKATPRVSKKIREEAYWLLRHFPGEYDMTQPSRSFEPLKITSKE